MAVTVTMPQLGESVTEGTIQQWLKQPGDPVEQYESIAEVNTDKVNAEIPSPVAGTMGEHLVGEGAVVPVGQPICEIEGAAQEPVAAAPPPAAAARGEAPAEISAPEKISPPAASVSERAGVVPRNGGMHVTPAVRMLASEHAVDLTQITGSGIGGRVTKKDVLEFVQRRDAAPAQPQARPEPVGGVAARRAEAAAAPLPAPQATGADTLVPLTPMRRAIAEHMSRSVLTSPHAWTMVEVDMTRVARIRTRRREDFRARHGADLTFLPFVARAVIAALQKHPTLNSTWTDDGVLLRREINLGIAVALEDGLIVPVIKGADRLSLSGLALAAQDLGDRARAGKLRVDDVEGGTFTLNNAGALGTVMSQAIINQPQAAILVMDAIVKRPVVVEDDAIAVRSMMNLCISFDHRINDGLPAARFLRSIKETLESIDEASADLW
jgi:2-oxoisovalerate dehydrogenase E2 component (dihydrolipoyl transacylase)